jgi:two-component system OmpR family sensor kinase/two-component system sensor histidine kinase BaeS
MWRQVRGRFFRRVGLFLFFVFLITAVVPSVLFALAGGFRGFPDGNVGFRPWFPFPFAFFMPLLFFGGLLLILVALRRVATPVGDLLEATGRVAEGDYSARVPEQGPPEVRQLAQAFNAMTERLRSQEERRRTLLAEVTHELRTPLTVLQGNLEGMVDGVYPRDDAHLEAVLDETRVLSRLIEDLRVLSLAESGTLKLQLEQIDLGDLAREVVTAFHAEADRTGVTLSADCGPDLPSVQGDATRIREVLANLIANALRYTPQGGTVEVRVWRLRGAERRLAVAVRDSGAGIPPEALPHIFDRFYKSPDSRGAGLGLAIARNLVIAHGGEITATSEPGKGTEIRFTLPEG